MKKMMAMKIFRFLCYETKFQRLIGGNNYFTTTEAVKTKNTVSKIANLTQSHRKKICSNY